MKRVSAFVLLSVTATVGAAAPPVVGQRGAVYEIQPSAALLSQFAHAEQTLAFLADRGWDIRDLRVRLTGDPYDATQAAADVVLPAFLPLEDQFFLLVQAVVRKNLGGSALASELAHLVAASLAPPSSRLRQQWEAGFQAALLAGEVERTALLQLLWRTGRDASVRAVQNVEDAWRLLGLHEDRERVAEALWDVMLAALLAPSRLGWTVPPVPLSSIPVSGGATSVRFSGSRVRWMQVPPTGDGVGVLPSRLWRASARLVVVYEDGRLDAVKLAPSEETKASFWGVRALLVGVVSFPGEAVASFAFRELRDYPVRLGAVDLMADGETWQLSWEVESQDDVDAFVVEVRTVGGDGERVAEHHLIPTAGSGPVLLAWSTEARGEICQLQVYALTRQGVLAKLFTSPLLTLSGEHQPKSPPQQ